MPQEQNKEMCKRFDERFMPNIDLDSDNDEVIVGYSVDANEAKRFTQSEIDLAVVDERKRVEKIINDYFGNDRTALLLTPEDIINLITNPNA